MAGKRSSELKVSSLGDWVVRPLVGRGGRRAAAVAEDTMVQVLTASRRLEVAGAFEAELPARRGIEEQALVIDIEPPDEGAYVVMARHASGAVTFHAGAAVPRRRGTRATRGVLHFSIVTSGSSGGDKERRGVAGKVLRFFLMKIVGALLDVAIEKLAKVWEEHCWRKKGLPRGLLRVALDAGDTLRLAPVSDKAVLATGRNLLFVHGTFSDFASGFGALASACGRDGRGFFAAAREIYGDRIFAFNHFTVSQKPVENAKQLLSALPEGGASFDAITHSRGALVLRSLVERPQGLDGLAGRFRLGNAVLVAGPNQGTPLASPERWETLTSWIATLVDLFGENLFTFGVDFVCEALAWIASKVGGVIPGLAAMNPQGRFIAELQDLPLPTGRLSALTASYEPDQSLLARAADVGVDAFFGSANDLVVPTEGGWRVDVEHGVVIPSDRIGCFGPGGNLESAGKESVHHCSFFDQPATVDFLLRGVQGEAQGLSPVDPTADLPTSRARQRAGAATPSGPALARSSVPVEPPGQRPLPPVSSVVAAAAMAPSPVSAYPLDEILNLFILVPEVAAGDEAERECEPVEATAGDFARLVASSTKSQTALMIASFRNARIYAQFRTGGGMAGQRWKRLIDMHRKIKGYVNGDANVTSLPDDAELREFGALLFNTLFPGQVRRLYDAARAELRDRRLDVCLTSTIGWVADMPWEFAFDPSRQMFLCMEEVNFLRNVATAVPADPIGAGLRPLRILVVAAQPIGAGALSIAEEEAVIRRAFQPLQEQGLASVDVVAGVTPELLHQLLLRGDVTGCGYDILHFIGHGEFNADTGFGSLLFEDADGRAYELRADHFRQIVAKRGIRLVFLNACETGMGIGRHRSFDFAQGVAPMLVAGGVPAVVANQFKVLDPSATAFAQHFYWALATGRTIGDAAREARVAVNYSIAGESIDWAVPVLFARNPGDRMRAPLAPAAGESGRPVAQLARTQKRRRATDGKEHVAIWDVNYILPNLDDVVRRLNEVQSHFCFEETTVPAPLGTWRRRQTDQGTACFYLSELESRLRGLVQRLGVQHLCCVMNWPLAEEKTSELVADVNQRGDISIVSTEYLLQKLDPPSTTLERLVTNQLIFNLSGLDAHDKAPKDCPSYFNREGDMRWFAGPLRFCPSCLRKLQKGARREALIALTKAYPIA